MKHLCILICHFDFLSLIFDICLDLFFGDWKLELKELCARVTK